MSQQLIERIPLPFDYTIDENAKKRAGVLLTMEGRFQRVDTKNANKRKYPRGVFEKVLASDEVKDMLTNRTMLGMLDHPADGKTVTERASHIVTSQRLMPDGDVNGSLDVLDTPSGRVLETLVRAGVKVGISSRGDGSLVKKGDCDEVQDDFKLGTYDIVLKPSTFGAHPTLSESELQETWRENAGQIVEAVGSLVKCTEEVPVLLECFKIISALGVGDSVSKKSVEEAIQQKLEHRPSEEAEVEEPTEVEEAVADREVVPMSKDSNVLPESETSKITGLYEAKIAEVTDQKDKEISELKDKLAEVSESDREGLIRLRAAEEIIETQLDMIDNLKTNLEETSSTDGNLQARFEAARDLLDAAIPKLEELGQVRRRYRVAERCLEASITHVREAVVDYATDRMIANAPELSESQKGHIRAVLAECKSATEAKSKFEHLRSMLGESQKEFVREPLPTTPQQPGGQVPLQEGQQPRPPTSSFMLNRMLQVVTQGR